jgi:hypothetical protein
VPGVGYALDVTWRAASKESDTQPAASEPGTLSGSTTQSFRFTAEDTAHAPTDLVPWILASSPGMADVGVFCTEPVRLALVSQKVTALFAAYGKELRVVVHSASGHHPPAPGGGGPGDLLTLAVDPTQFAFGSKGSGLGVQSPFVETLTVVGRAREWECVDVDSVDDHTYTVTLPYEFEPLTEYLLDIHAVPVGAPSSARGLVHRVGFTTSRFATVQEMAGYVLPAAVDHRLVAVPAALQDPASLPDRPLGAQLDAAFQAAGLAPPTTPGYPAVQVLWSPDPVPQPVAVVVECSEPLWRSRLMPTQITAPPDASDPTHKWWAARPAEWLRLEPSTAPVAVGDLPRAGVTRLVRGPGDTRAVVLLGAGSRDHEVRLDLVVASDPLAQTPDKRETAVRISLRRAPWEVED